MNDDEIVIVGAGLAGYTLAKELRKLAPERAVTLVTADSGDVYSKPMLSNALAQGNTAESLVQAKAEDQAGKLGIRVVRQCAVRAIDRAGKKLETDGGPIHYGRLVLALGAQPRRPDFPGAEAMLSVNNLDDYAKFRARLSPGAKVLILGGGLVGCEFANDLALGGYRAVVVEAGAHPLGSQVPDSLAERLSKSLAALGVDCLCGNGIERVEETSGGYTVKLAGGESFEVDLLLSAIGLNPVTGIAAAAGLETKRGIVVDSLLATADPAIYALGDCAEVEGLLLPYVLPLMQQARALASTLAGVPAKVSLPAMPVAVKTPACPMVLCLPASGSTGRWQRERDDETGASYHFLGEGDALLGFALAGDACAQRRQLAARVPALLV